MGWCIGLYELDEGQWMMSKEPKARIEPGQGEAGGPGWWARSRQATASTRPTREPGPTQAEFSTFLHTRAGVGWGGAGGVERSGGGCAERALCAQTVAHKQEGGGSQLGRCCGSARAPASQITASQGQHEQHPKI